MKTVRVGFVGCGRVTETRHLAALRGVRGVEAVALADVDAERLSRVGERYGVARRYEDWRGLVRDESVDAVAVCVPPALHAPVALAALEARKHVFVEKPLALTLEECDLLDAAAARAEGLKVAVGFNMRFHRLVREARGHVERGSLGRVKLVRTVFASGMRARPEYPSWRLRRESGGGAIFELGTHHFDLVRFMTGQEAREVYASCDETDETCVVTLKTDAGVQVVTALSEGTTEGHELEFYGERGWLRVSCYRADGIERLDAGQYAGSVRTRINNLTGTLRALPRVLAQARRGGDYVNSYAEEWRHFAESVRGRARVSATLEDGRRALEMALAAAESSRTARAVKIDDSSSKFKVASSKFKSRRSELI
ncbi:MAG TPA: Gfo/Idh/MocA family oxidoreductase [Pyrinomonadaceae bacterium]|nr:Gfo/Idh/MocA family oxidoreductase [Pyrinomonadaceae bacterium]